MVFSWTDAALWAVGLSGGILSLRLAWTGLVALYRGLQVTLQGFAWLICRSQALYARLTAPNGTLGTDVPTRGVSA